MLGQVSEPNTVQKQFSTHVFNDSPSHFSFHFVHFDFPGAWWPLKIISSYPKGHAIKFKFEFYTSIILDFNPVTTFCQDKKWQISFPNMSLNVVQSKQ